MTGNQLTYLRNEAEKANNLVVNAETHRHQLAMEQETNRNNLALEAQGRATLEETGRHNLATEAATKAQNKEQKRHDKATEKQSKQQTKTQAKTAKTTAKISAGATKYSAKTSAAASKYGADTSAAANKYAADKSAEASKYSSDVNKSINAAKIAGDRANTLLKENNANNRAKLSAQLEVFKKRIDNLMNNKKLKSAEKQTLQKINAEIAQTNARIKADMTKTVIQSITSTVNTWSNNIGKIASTAGLFAK